MIFSILTALFFASRAGAAVAGFGLVIGSVAYDWRSHRKLSLSTRSKLPLISVLVNGSEDIRECLKRAAGSSYRRAEIVLLVSHRLPAAPLPLRQTKYPVKQVLVPPTGLSSKKRWERLSRLVKGDLVLVLDSRARLEPGTLKDLATEFGRNNNADVIRLRQAARPQPTLRNLAMEYELATQVALEKTKDTLGLSDSVGHPAIAWRRKAWLTSIKPSRGKAPRVRYSQAASVNVTERLDAARPAAAPKPVWRVWLERWGAAFLLLEPLLLAYSVYVFLAFEASILLVSTWLIIIVSLGFFTWSDEQLELTRRWRLTLLLPLTPTLAYFSLAWRWLKLLRPAFAPLASRRKKHRLSMSAARRVV